MSNSFKVYLCGGAVRDHLLHIDSRDRDYVVVGSSFDEMLQLGFKQVGVAFPVFLHPETGEEYALARRERKTAPGYSGFEVEFGSDVTLEEDLFRRDLTINSMAMTDNFQVVDPYGGVKDLEDGVLRHTSEAFADDPLRVLRLARFAARYGFRVANETMELARKLVSNKELDALSADRVWVEVEKLLKEKNPLAGLCVLKDAGCEKVESLNMLLNFSSVDYYESLSSKFVDLNFDMKAYTFTEVARLTNDEANTLRVPSDLLRKMRFYQKFTFLMTGYFEYFETFAVEMFDTFRMEMNKKDYLYVVVLLNKMHGNGMTYGNREAIEHVYKDFCGLDLEAFVKTVPPKEIKTKVRELKLKTVADSFRNYRPHVVS